jgi:hypothetical protein
MTILLIAGITGAVYLVTALLSALIEIASNPEATGCTILRAAAAGPLVCLWICMRR